MHQLVGSYDRVDESGDLVGDHKNGEGYCVLAVLALTVVWKIRWESITFTLPSVFLVPHGLAITVFEIPIFFNLDKTWVSAIDSSLFFKSEIISGNSHTILVNGDSCIPRIMSMNNMVDAHVAE